jgi:hypothetical protein
VIYEENNHWSIVGKQKIPTSLFEDDLEIDSFITEGLQNGTDEAVRFRKVEFKQTEVNVLLKEGRNLMMKKSWYMNG